MECADRESAACISRRRDRCCAETKSARTPRQRNRLLFEVSLTRCPASLHRSWSSTAHWKCSQYRSADRTVLLRRPNHCVFHLHARCVAAPGVRRDKLISAITHLGGWRIHEAAFRAGLRHSGPPGAKCRVGMIIVREGVVRGFR